MDRNFNNWHVRIASTSTGSITLGLYSNAPLTSGILGNYPANYKKNGICWSTMSDISFHFAINHNVPLSTLVRIRL